MTRSVTTYLGWPEGVAQPDDYTPDFEAHKRAGWVAFAWQDKDFAGVILSMNLPDINEFTTRWLMNGEIIETPNVKET